MWETMSPFAYLLQARAFSELIGLLANPHRKIQQKQAAIVAVKQTNSAKFSACTIQRGCRSPQENLS